MRLRLVSYNIHSGVGTDGRLDLDRIARVLRDEQADLICLQELGHHRDPAHGGAAEPEVLAEALGMRFAFGPNVVNGKWRFGNAVLSRLPIHSHQNYDLSVEGRERRGALRCDIDLGEEKLLHLFSVHLGLSGAERRAQQALLLSADILRETARAHPAIVCGDFNHWRKGPIEALVRSSMRDVHQILPAGATFPSRWPVLRLDRVYVDAGVRPLALRVGKSALARRASDHLPVILDFDAPFEEGAVGARLPP